MRIPANLLAGLLAALLGAPAALTPLTCAAAPFAVRLGTEKIALDTIPGFSDTTELASPRLQDLAADLTSLANRVLLFALTEADLRRFQNGERMDKKRRYLLVATPKELERERVRPEGFNTLVSSSIQEIGKLEQVPDLIKFLEERPIGLTQFLGELRNEPTTVTLLQATRLAPLPGERLFDRSTPQYLLFTTSYVLVRGKALIVSVYTLYFDQADMDWVKVATQRWVDELKRLNR